MPVMTYSRYVFDHIIFDAGFHDGVRSSCHLLVVHPHPYLTMTRSVMILLISCLRSDIARATVPSVLCRATRN